MAQQAFNHLSYKVVGEHQADFFAWAFLDGTTMKRLALTFPELQPHEVRAKVTYTGLCHSDVHTVTGEWGPCPHPIVPGHEIVGVVTHVGSDVKDFRIGDKVGFGAQRNCCDECEYCKLTYDQLCNGKVDQKFTYGDRFWGGYATSIQHPAKFYFKIPENLPEEKIPPLFCAGATTYSPVAKYAKSGDEVAILGIGGLGHMAVKYAKAWGCKVTGFTSSKDKEQFIKDLGADRVVVTSPETLQQEAGKYHLVLNTLPVNDQLTSYVQLTKPLGTFCQIGMPPFGKPGPFNPAPLIQGHIVFVGSMIGSRKEIKEMLEFSSKHNIVPLCEHFSFEDFPKAYDRLVNGRPKFRCVVDCTQSSPKHA